MGHIADTVNRIATQHIAPLESVHAKDIEGLGETIEKELLTKYFPLALIHEGLRIIDDSAEETVAEITNDDGTELSADLRSMFVTGVKSGTDCLREIVAIIQAGGIEVLPFGDLATGEES